MKRDRLMELAAAGLLTPLLLATAGCDNTESQSKKTTTTVKETPSGTTTTTEKTEKKVEHDPK